MTITCCVCFSTLSSWHMYTIHLRANHALHWTGSTVICGQNGCPRRFDSFNSLRKHMNHQHADILQLDETIGDMQGTTSSDAPIVDMAESSNSNNQQFDSSGQWQSNSDRDYHSIMTDFVCRLQAKANANTKLVDDVLDMVKTLVSNIVDQFSMHIVEGSASDISSAGTKLRELPNIVESFSSEYKRLKLLKSSGLYVDPSEHVVGCRTETQFSSRVGFSTSVAVEDKMYFIPLHSLFSLIFSSLRVEQLLRERTHALLNCSKRLKHISDGILYKQHPLFEAHPDSLILHLYIDAYETTNPLGSHTGIHKMEALYMIIQNFPTSLTSRTNQIFTVAIWNALDSKRYGYDNVLKPVVTELKQLESDAGLIVNMRGQDRVMHGTVLIFSADYLGAHSLFGFLESFMARKFCRFCECTKEQVQSKFKETDFQLRSKQSYDTAVAKLSDPLYNPSTTDPAVLAVLKGLARKLSPRGKKITASEAVDHVVKFLSPGQPVYFEENKVSPRLFCTESDSGQRKFCMTMAGRQLEAFPSLLENVDLSYKACWVFNIRYMSSVELIYKFLEFSIYKQREGRVPNCIVELASVLSSPKYKSD